MRAALILLLAAAAAAHAAPPAAPPAPAPLTADDQKAEQLLDQLAKASDAGARKQAIDQLDQLAPRAINGIGAFLARTHTASLDDRRKVLEAIQAQVPDKNGRFVTPERKSAKEEKADDDLDWMAGLAALDPATPGLGEVIADDAAIRALAATKDVHAAQLVFDTAFMPETIIYRDECGRYLRKMEPYSTPSLIGELGSRSYDRQRYANYQLERMDRQEPGKALASAQSDEALTIAILDAYRKSHFREAVHAVWGEVTADSPRVRAAARAAWMAYITDRPPPAPKKKLMMPGGKLTKEPKPLWLTYRELADNELRKAANDLLHEDYPLIPDPTLDDSDADKPWRKPKRVEIDLKGVTERLFAYFDDQRAKREADRWTAAKALADKGDVAGATRSLDQLLAASPDFGTPAVRDQMVGVYLAYAKQLEDKQQWADASAAYSKAHGLDPSGAHAKDALAAADYTLGKSLEAQGKDGGPDFRRAIALNPEYKPAKVAEHEVETKGRPVWMLYAAALAMALATALFAVGMLKRRHAGNA